jgi:predicted outer membrane repeat protein
MSLARWLSNLGGPLARRKPLSVPSRFRPRLEALEERWQPSTLTVTNNHDSGTGSLRATISAAHSGDTIDFAPGLFAGGPETISLTSGELLLGKNLVITGPSQSSLTLSGNKTSRVFEVAAGKQVAVSGMTISNGFDVAGGGILNNGTLTLSNSTLSNDSANMYGKRASNAGGAIENNSILTLNGCTFSGNTSSTGGAIDSNAAGTVTLSNCVLSGNSAAASGGGISSRGTLTISNSNLNDNTALSNGGGIDSYGTARISSSTFTGNSVTGIGGAIANHGSLLVVTACTLTGNRANNDGGGISSTNNPYATLTISDSTLSGNTAWAGAGIYAWNGWGQTTISNCQLDGNSASNWAGAIYDGSGTMTVTGSTLNGNSAPLGAGIYAYQGLLTIDGSTLSSNTATVAGGGLYIAVPPSGITSSVTVKDLSNIAGNTAPSGFGADILDKGVLYLDGTSTIGALDGNAASPI